ncbi:hypothetical protein BYT27DRAFT_7195138 [Phlegmacium glaucopus]|nr:hypothetical protein BYT27DRAFT_7195138 [Phlegmacium glaucopus]
MHFYTEAPITSFFPRITASKKRKIHTEPTPSSSVSNKQRDNTSATSQGIKSKAKEDGKKRRNSMDISRLHSPSVEDLSTPRPTKSLRQQTSERHMPLLPSLNAKVVTTHTPKPNALPSRKRRKTSLQTPPPTNPGTEFMELTPTLSPFISRKLPGLRIEKVLLPTPSTLGRSASHHNGYSGNDLCRVVQGHLFHQDSSPPTPPQHSDTSLKESGPLSIPSSQSQLMANGCYEDGDHSTPAGTAWPCQRLQDEAQLFLPNRIHLNQGDEPDSTSHAEMFIPSSQSQFLSSFDEYDSPQRSQPTSIASNPDDIVPSSQSQEHELRMLNDPEGCYQSMRSDRQQALPQRTLSDELFSVSILQTDWLDGSFDPEQPIQRIADVIPGVVNNRDDSATESETEPETEEKDSYHRDHRLTAMHSQPYGFSQLSTADLTSFNEDSQPRDSQQSSQDLSLADQASSFASLPSAVKEFQNMFGSDDESYPSDFPMSLR